MSTALVNGFDGQGAQEHSTSIEDDWGLFQLDFEFKSTSNGETPQTIQQGIDILGVDEENQYDMVSISGDSQGHDDTWRSMLKPRHELSSSTSSIRSCKTIKPTNKAVKFVDAVTEIKPETSGDVNSMIESKPWLNPPDEAVGEMSFLEWYPKGTGTIKYRDDDGLVQSLDELSVWIIEERSPLLAAAFEESLSGPQLFLAALSSATARPLLRFLYTGTYAMVGPVGDLYADTPTSLLLHCQLYNLATIFDMAELKSQAYVNIVRQCEFGCSSPDKPIDLCRAISFIYEHLAEHTSVIETITSYCVTCFARNHLDEDPEYRTLSYDLQPFHRDLCRELRTRGFEDDTAAAIIRMPFKSYTPLTYLSREDAAAARVAGIGDFVHHFHSTDRFDAADPAPPLSPGRKRKRAELFAGNAQSIPSPSPPPPPVSALTLALRGKREDNATDGTAVEHGQPSHLDEAATEAESSGEEKKKVKTTDSGEPVRDWLADQSSDSEYDRVSGPGSVRSFDSDSEDKDVEFNKVRLVAATPALLLSLSSSSSIASRDMSLPVRSRPIAGLNRNPSADDADSGNETDWSLV